MNLLDKLRENPFVLAPMAGITDCAFRSYMRELGAGIVVTELVSATGLKYSSEKTKKLMQFSNDQHPVGIQLFGEDLEALSIAAKEVEQMGADFVDINFGCPVPKVVKKGAGSAALKDLVFLRDVVRAVKTAVKIPVTIKVRTGWDANSRNTNAVTQIAYDEGVTWVAIHGRTRAQGYEGLADWEFIQQVKAQSKVPIIGNGDITTPGLAVKRLNDSGCDAVMIGRGCLKNPWIFQESIERHKKSQTTEVKKDFVSLFDKLESYLIKSHDARVVALQTKKLAAWYSAGYPESANFRKSIFAITDARQIQDSVREYFSKHSNFVQQDTSQERFLMGGHG